MCSILLICIFPPTSYMFFIVSTLSFSARQNAKSLQSPCSVGRIFSLPHPCAPYLGIFDRFIALESLNDSPQSPDKLGKLQQTGVDWQPQLAFCHGQLAVFKWIICDGYPQGSVHHTGEIMMGHQFVQINMNFA